MSQSGAQARGSGPDLLAGAVFLLIGGVGLLAGRDLRIGTGAAMGPGYLPLAVSTALVAVGLAVVAKGLIGQRQAIARPRLRPILLIVLATAGFAVAADWLGFVVAAAWVVGIGSLADRQARGFEVLALIAVLTLFGILVFVRGLGIQMPLWPV